MKKILGILILSFLLYNPSSFAVIKGKGEVKLTDRSVKNFMYYIRCDWPGKKKNERCRPELFVLSSGGDWSYFHYCAHNECWFNDRQTVRMCERETGDVCGVFAVRRTIVWDNGTKKRAKFSKKWSDREVKDELARLGFYGETTTRAKPEITEDIVAKLQKLKKLYDEGVLTKEEFEKAKKRILN